jgi:hypothetical protein
MNNIKNICNEDLDREILRLELEILHLTTSRTYAFTEDRRSTFSRMIKSSEVLIKLYKGLKDA